MVLRPGEPQDGNFAAQLLAFEVTGQFQNLGLGHQRIGLRSELAAAILLVAIVAAIALTMRRRTGVKTQDPSRQVEVRREDRIRIVQMPSEPRERADRP